jgi:polyisoprenoid-binding protein YceI
MSTTAVEIPGYVAGTYTIDPGHSDVAFTVRHLMVSKVRGHFTRFQGELALAPDPLASSVTATLDRGDFGISTNIPMDGGGVVIGDRIQVFIEIEAVLNPPQPTT